ncbi:MAG TPA: hypothetical protein VKV37_18580 [Ktedonobacteraceae bacterium]|nr:hypothetical protein [Ktedonobacteraceae bacterium]
MKKLICPFCFHAFRLEDAPFRCVIPSCPGSEIDEAYVRARGCSAVPMGRVLVPARRRRWSSAPREMRCDACSQTSRVRLCPHCHFELPHDMGLIDQRIVAIIGGRATGKTHYIATLITRLQQEVGKEFNLTVRMLGDNTQERWERDFYTPLFVNKTLLQPNRPAEVDASVKVPLIFRFTFNRGGYRRALNMSFFDSAGEDLTTLTSMSLYNRYILHADGIIFLLDPLQIPLVRAQLPPENLPPANPRSSPEQIVGRLRDLFEREHRLRVARPIKVPIAFALSKIDTLFPLFEPGSEFFHPGWHAGYLDLDDVQSVHTEVATCLAGWINQNFCNIIESSFACYNYFGVSSLGEAPGAGNRLTEVSPFRVEDPFLWLLYRLALIRGKKRR